MRTRVGIYCRLSSEDRKKNAPNDESESIQNQKMMLHNYALNQGWDIFETYIDDDFSGAGVYRPGFETMIADARTGKLDVILCKTLSRFSREFALNERHIFDNFKKWNIRFLALVDNIDSDKMDDKKYQQLLGLTNQWYIEDLSKNVRKVLISKKQAGQFTGSFASYGYLRSEEDRHKLIIDPVASVIVKKIFSLYRQGFGYAKIAMYLNQNNIPSPAEYKKIMDSNYKCGNIISDKSYWYNDTIAKMLKNDVYIGNMTQGKRQNISYKNKKTQAVPKKDWIVVKNTHEPIIDMETWDAVAKKFIGRLRPQSDGSIHIFSRKVYCQECKQVFHQKTSKSANGGKYYYLSCQSQKRGSLLCTNNRAIRVDALEEIILKNINSYIEKFRNPKTLSEKMEFIEKNKSTTKNKIKALNTERKNTNNTKIKKEHYQTKLYEDKIDGTITMEEYRRLSDKYNEDIKSLTERIQDIDEEIAAIEKSKIKAENKDDIFNRYQSIEKLDKQILDIFIEKIFIHNIEPNSKERKITIEWAI